MTIEAAPAQSFSHSGKFFNVLGLAVKNAALTVVTLTLYRFWARTSMRRRIWSRAWVMGDALEYTGSALELFRGFLLALPTFFIPAIFVLYIAPLMMEPWIAGWLTLGFYAASVPLIAAARYWMRRYQLTRTRWRGIRLGLTGSAWSFAWASWGWWVLQMLSLGWYTPVARMNRARMMWENTSFGSCGFKFEGDGEPPQKGLWLPFALGWFGFIIAVILAVVIAGAAAVALRAAGVLVEGDPGQIAYMAGAITGVLAALLTVIFAYAFWAPYRAAAMNRIAAHLVLDGARFRLKAKTFSLLGVSMLGWIITIFSLGLLAPVAGFLQIRYVLNRLEIIGAPRFAEIGQDVSAAPKVGEGLGDAFDLDMGVGII